MSPMRLANAGTTNSAISPTANAIKSILFKPFTSFQSLAYIMHDLQRNDFFQLKNQEFMERSLFKELKTRLEQIEEVIEPLGTLGPVNSFKPTYARASRS
jgi:hypothetical protein